MTNNFKQKLLLGTALVAVAGFAGTAAAADVTLGAATGTWSSSGNNNDDGTVAEAATGANLNATVDSTLTITNNGTANDGGGVNVFSLGDVTDTATKTLDIVITSGADANFTVAIDSVNIDGDFTITGNADAGNDGDIAVTLDDAAVASVIGGNLVINNSAVDGANNDISLTSAGALTVTGTTAVTAGTVDGSVAAFIANKAATFTGAVSFTGGGHANADATGLFQGNTTFTAGATLNDATGQAILTFDTTTDATGDITVSGNITAAQDNEGFIVISDDTDTTADTVTFSGNIGSSTADLNTITIGVTGADGGHGVFNGTVYSTAINVGVADPNGGTTTADFNGNVVTTTLQLLGGNTAGETANATIARNFTGNVELDDGTAGDGTTTVRFDGTTAQTITGSVLATGDDGEGTVIIGNTGTKSDVSITGTLGVDGADLDGVQVVSGSTLRIVNDIYTQQDANTGLGFDLDGTLVISSADNAVSVDEDTGDIDLNGTVTITGDNAVDFTAADALFIDGTFTSNLDAGIDLTWSSANNTLIGADSNTTINTSNQIVNAGDLYIGDNDGFTTTLNLTRTAGFNPNVEANAFIVADGGTVELDSDSKLRISIASDTVEYDNGDQIWILDSDEAVELDNVDTNYATLVADGNIVGLINGLLGMSVVTDGIDESQDFVVAVDFQDAADVFERDTYAGAANSLLNIASANTTAELEDIRQALISADTDDEAEDIAESISPTIDGGNVAGALTVSNVTADIVQLASLDAEGSGIAAGNISNGLRAWAQVFGQTGEQDARDGIDGFDIDTYGFALGLDTQALADQMVLGLAFSYADSEIDSDNQNRTETEVDTYQITLYGTYNVDEATYVSGQLGYAFGDNETRRHDLAGINTLDANGDFDSNQFLARLEAGRAYEVGAITTLTPKLLANYNYYDADSYTETGAGNAGLHIDQDTLHVFELGAGVDADWMFQQADGSYVKPAVSLGFRYDLADDEVETTSEFIGGGAAFKTEGWDPQQFTVDAGASVTYFSTTNWELTADYNYEWKEDYDSHAGFLRAGYKF